MYSHVDQYTASSNIQAGIHFWYGIIICVGSIMNIYVLYRTKRLYARDPEQFRNGIGICLCILATSDIVALSALLMHFLLMTCNSMLSKILNDIFCKITMFSLHTAYTQSMWCWFFMSALRFIATSRPFQYTTLWRLPYLMIGLSFAGSVIENAWLLIFVQSDNSSCILHSTAPTRAYWIFHVFISFVIPCILILYMDSSVLCCRIRTKYSDPMLQIVINRPCGEKFAFNAFYLITFIYEKSLMSKTNSSRQLSMSFRQRLEENGHLIRERANTVSYRATSPMPPVLVRNSSCCALDRLVPQKHWL
ncbi:hypothetical protein FO519_006141 [Halicephalobus sp. NKZ332]|nr:hypothetical protein FO519_006141 [Halicephalobus sp. NKZ332]